MADQRLRQLKIKTGVVKRLTKEKFSYIKEAEQQEARIEKMKVEGKDEYDIKKQGEVLQESVLMVPDTEKRLKRGLQDLKANMDEVQSDLGETEEYTTAVTIYEDGQKALPAS